MGLVRSYTAAQQRAYLDGLGEMREGGAPQWDALRVFGSSARLLYDPAVASSVTASSSLVSSFANLGQTAGAALTQATGGAQATFVASDQDGNNQPCLKYSGAQFMDTGVLASEASPRTIVLVCICDDRASTSWFTDGPVSSMGQIIRFGADNYYIGSGGAVNGLWGGVTGGDASSKDGLISVSQQVHILEGYFNGAGSQFYADGVLKATGNAGTTATTGRRVGARTGGSSFVNGASSITSS